MLATGYYATAMLLTADSDVDYAADIAPEYFRFSTMLDRSHPRMHFCYNYLNCRKRGVVL